MPDDLDIIRLYRANSGAVVTDYQFVADIKVNKKDDPISSKWEIDVTYIDTKESFELGEVIPSETWLKPPTKLEQVVLAGDGVLVAFKKNRLYFSEQYLPHAWPPDYYISIEHDIVALVATAGDVVVLTNGSPYLVGGALPAAAMVQKLDIDAACVNREATTTLGNNVVYAGTDGIVSVVAGQATNLTYGLLTREQYLALNPTSMRMYTYGNNILVTYDASAHPFTDPIAPVKGTMVIRIQEQYLEFYETYFQSAVIRPHDDRLFFIDRADDKTLYEWSPSFELPGAIPFAYQWTSKTFMFARDTYMTCAQVDAETYPVEFKLYRDEVLIHTLSVPDREVFRLPPGRGKNWKFQLSSTHRVYQVHIADNVRDLAVDMNVPQVQ